MSSAPHGSTTAPPVGIVRNRPFNDRNKRTAFVAAIAFLEQLGQRFQASESDVVVQMVALADHVVGEIEFTTWIRENSVPAMPGE